MFFFPAVVSYEQRCVVADGYGCRRTDRIAFYHAYSSAYGEAFFAVFLHKAPIGEFYVYIMEIVEQFGTEAVICIVFGRFGGGWEDCRSGVLYKLRPAVFRRGDVDSYAEHRRVEASGFG